MMRLLLCLTLLLLPACREDTAKAPPPPATMTETALSHFCQMNVAAHGGPKGQVHLEGFEVPLFFAQVRDLVAYLKSPEREARIVAVYVSDMAAAPSWAEPGRDNWIATADAVFVVGAGVAGGMGAPEIVPFANPAAAEDFIARYGGRAVALDDIPDDAAIGPVDLDLTLEVPTWNQS